MRRLWILAMPIIFLAWLITTIHDWFISEWHKKDPGYWPWIVIGEIVVLMIFAMTRFQG